MTAIDFSAFVDELASVSGETILPFFRTALSVEDKGRTGGFDPVTAADHAAETAMRALIRRTFPDHGIIGEEFGKERADAEYVWVLDPIDGTKSFISGMPAWGTLIALLRSGEPVYGMMNQPFTRERFSGDGGRAHYRGQNGERDLRVRACADLASAVLFTTSPLLMNARDREIFARVEQAVRLSLRRRLLRLLHAGGGPCRSGDRNGAQPLRCAPAGADHHRRRRHHHQLGRRRPACGRTHHCGGR
jgi:histidinol-phosphatase